jgi:hypothetical protein
MPVSTTPIAVPALPADAGAPPPAQMHARPELAIDRLDTQVAAALAALVQVERDRVAGEQHAHARAAALRDEAKDELQRLREEHAATPAGIDADAVLAALKQECERRLAWVTQAATNRRRALRAALGERLANLERQVPEAKAHQPSADELASATRARTDFQAAITALRTRLGAARDALQGAGKGIGLALDPGGVPPTPLPHWELNRRLGLVRQELSAAEAALPPIVDSSGYRTARPLGRFLFHFLATIPPALGAAAAILVPLPDLMPYAIAVAIAGQVGVYAWTWVRRRGAARKLVPLAPALHQVAGRLDLLEAAGLKELDPQARLAAHLARIDGDDRPARAAAFQAETDARLAVLKKKEAALGDRLRKRVAAAAGTVHQEAARRAQARAGREAGEIQRAERAARDRQAAAEAERAAAHAALQTRWQAATAALIAAAAAPLAAAAARHAEWNDPAWAAWNAPAAFPTDLPIGTLRIGLVALVAAALAPASTPVFGAPPGAMPTGAFPLPAQDLVLPLALCLPAPASLLVRAGPANRAQAIAIANQLALRALAGFPPGRLRLTLIDPVGLGASFASLLAAADDGSSGGGVLGGGILNDPGRIERGIDDLIAHLEVVIQKHLRGRYATIDDYNREAGEMQEALRLVVVADFPAGFSERAVERLTVLARSGARCGVHLVVVHDQRRAIPAGFDLGWFRAHAVILGEALGDALAEGNGAEPGDHRPHLALDREALRGWDFRHLAPPPPALATALLERIAANAAKALRIEVPFAAVAPTEAERWSLSTARELLIPIGKRGADRRQYLELGRGTAQHVLIGGRTGSGKSTLFHILVTSAALWHHPRELEFHLIDFKKGVEFKAYATHRLPHAQVIAIESDREFGLSVLRRLDAELTRRGDAFRKLGAQDLAAHRAQSAQSGGEFLPRILLLIDEFQEFFTEDDTVARDAALLLDRFVRQGRAFGLHVVLGSQTLGGAYALARSSIGQMGVRIALPCNESDAHLLLDEANDAARLLTRPGDAIYNDRAGMVEGNSPFQVCWLPEDEEGRHLAAIATATRADGWRPPRPAVVFEGNGPSDLADEPVIATLLDRPADHPAAAGRLAAGVGQSSSLKGPAEVAFPLAAAGNLLIVGQNREAAAATCAALMLGAAARLAPGAVRFVALDGEDRDGVFAALHRQLAAALPHAPVRHESRDVAAALAELAALLDRRQSGADPERSPVIVTAFALQRLRQLRPDDDFGGGGGGENPSELFAKLLANGPEYGLHTVVWCDALASVQRGLGRRALRDFDQRILFQMSAADSAELVDDDGASRLGLHTALLIGLGEGLREKFRPFSLPDANLLDRVGTALRLRFPGT